MLVSRKLKTNHAPSLQHCLSLLACFCFVLFEIEFCYTVSIFKTSSALSGIEWDSNKGRAAICPERGGVHHVTSIGVTVLNQALMLAAVAFNITFPCPFHLKKKIVLVFFFFNFFPITPDLILNQPFPPSIVRLPSQK